VVSLDAAVGHVVSQTSNVVIFLDNS